MLAFLFGVLSGALMSIQGVFNSGVTKQTSVWVAAGMVQLSAFFVCVIAWAVDGRKPVGKLLQVRPAYLLLGGVIGAFITITVVKSMEALGPAKATMIIVIAQLFVSWLIELFGLFGTKRVPFEWKRLLALALMAAGVVWFRSGKS